MSLGQLLPLVEQDEASKQGLRAQGRQETIAQYMATANQIRGQQTHLSNLQTALALITDHNTHQPAAGQEAEAARLKGLIDQFNPTVLQQNLDQVEGYIRKLYDPNFNPETGMPGRSPIRALGEKLHLVKPQQTPLAQPSQEPTPQAPGPPNMNMATGLPNLPPQQPQPQRMTAGELIKGLRDIRQKYDVAAPGIETGEQELAGEAAQREQERTATQRMDYIAAEGEKRGWSDEQIQQMQGAQFGLPKPTAARKPTALQGSVTVDGKQRPVVQEIDADGGITLKYLSGEDVPDDVKDTFKPTGKGAGTGKPTQYDEQLDVYLRTKGKTRETMTLADQEEFIKSRVPYGDDKLLMAQQRLKLDRLRVSLMQSQQNFQDTMELQKQMLPMERIQTGSTLADGWVTNHSPQGDSALIFAFLDAVKTSGFRFNQAEQSFIVNARPLMEGLNQRYIQGLETGETLTPPQRQNMANIIKAAAGQATERQGRIFGAVAPFKPEAAAAAQRITQTGGAGGGAETPVGTVKPGANGTQFRKSKPGPDSDRNTWEQVPAATAAPAKTPAAQATPQKTQPAPPPPPPPKPSAGRRSIFGGGHYVDEIVEYKGTPLRVTKVDAQGTVTGTSIQLSP